MSHDRINRFASGQDLFDEAFRLLSLSDSVLRVDDTVLDKPYARYIAYIGHL